MQPSIAARARPEQHGAAPLNFPWSFASSDARSILDGNRSGSSTKSRRTWGSFRTGIRTPRIFVSSHPSTRPPAVVDCHPSFSNSAGVACPLEIQRRTSGRELARGITFSREGKTAHEEPPGGPKASRNSGLWKVGQRPVQICLHAFARKTLPLLRLLFHAHQRSSSRPCRHSVELVASTNTRFHNKIQRWQPARPCGVPGIVNNRSRFLVGPFQANLL